MFQGLKDKARDFVVDEFHKVVYNASSPWFMSLWRGWPITKNPCDLMMMQRLVHSVQPDLIIETGTASGGSALFWADMCQLNGKGRVISVDIHPQDYLPKHERITFMRGSSIDGQIQEELFVAASQCKSVLVNLDSDHSKDHVLAEMEFYGQLVTPGSYMIVEDSNINGNPVFTGYGPGPMEAIHAFLPEHPEFMIDKSCESYLLTFHPDGWLKKTG